MKLSPVQVERVEEHIDGQVIPETHASSPQLETVFGNHTFFLDSEGLSIVEPSSEDEHLGSIVKLANWTDDRRTTLAPHPPQPTPVVVDLEATGEIDEED